VEVSAEFRDFFGAFVTKSSKNSLVLSFNYVSAFNNFKSADMIATHVGEFHLVLFDKEVKHSRYRPRVAQRVPGSLGSQIS